MIRYFLLEKHTVIPSFLIGFFLFYSAVSVAENMAFKGVLIEPPICSINNGQSIDIDFGERVGVSKVNGVNYLQQVNYRIRCTPGNGYWVMTLSVIGNAVSFDKAALASNVAGLGIQLRQAGKPFELNKPLRIDLNNPPVLEAVPVKMPGAVLTEGVFEATGTLQAEYQ